MPNLALLPPDAVTLKDGHPITTSLRVAAAFNKRHNDLLRTIRSLDCSPEFNARNFAHVDYLDEKGESRPMVEIRRDGVMLLIMGFTGAKAAALKEAFIARFNALEHALEQAPAAPHPGPTEAQRLLVENSALKDRLIALLEGQLAAVTAAGQRPKRRAATPLTPAEHQQICTLLAAGLGTREIAKRLGRSPATVSMLARGLALGAGGVA